MRGAFPMSVVQERREIANQVPTKAFLQPAVTVAMCCHLKGEALQGERSIFYGNLQNGLDQLITYAAKVG